MDRINQALEKCLRHFCDYYQDDWNELLPLAQVTIMARDAASTGVGPFFLSHGYHRRVSDGIIFLTDASPGTLRNLVEAA